MNLFHKRSATTLCAAFLLSTIAVTNHAIAESPTKVNDPLLLAMQQELDREKGLMLPGMQKPYFVEYRLDDISTYEAVANYGALTQEASNHQRVVRVTVRIGDYAADSSSTRGDGSIELAPLDDSPLALQYALWTATDSAYKNALRAFSAKQAALKQFQSAQNQQDFAQAKPVVEILPLVSLDLDRNDWRHRIIEASGLYATDSDVKGFAEKVQYSTANIRGIALNRYLVNTEGTMVRQGYTGYNGAISVGGQASDGMRLGRDNGTVATNAKDLESASAFRKRVIEDLKSFDELCKAPVISAEDYHGPVLFSGDAAADVFTRLFVPNIEADRPEMGTSARTTGAFSSSLKSRVLPETISVVDNPLDTKFNGKSLLGAYVIDDEGVPAQSVDVVDHGKLENFVIGREPIKDFSSSNGHGRASPAQASHSRTGVLIIKADQPLTKDELNKRLLTMAKDQGKDVYAVETLGGNELAPRLLYRVHPDGSRELVRGASFDELDNRSLRSGIIAAGNDPYVSNSLGAVPQTIIVPSILFEEIGVKRATVEQQKLPYYSPPPVSGK
jgi:TldD protein